MTRPHPAQMIPTKKRKISRPRSAMRPQSRAITPHPHQAAWDDVWSSRDRVIPDWKPLK